MLDGTYRLEATDTAGCGSGGTHTITFTIEARSGALHRWPETGEWSLDLGWTGSFWSVGDKAGWLEGYLPVTDGSSDGVTFQIASGNVSAPSWVGAALTRRGSGFKGYFQDGSTKEAPLLDGECTYSARVTRQ